MDKDENPFADAFGGKLSTEEEALRYIREHGDLVSSDPIKKQIAIDRIVDKVVYGKKDKPMKTFWDKFYELTEYTITIPVDTPTRKTIYLILRNIPFICDMIIISLLIYAIFN